MLKPIAFSAFFKKMLVCKEKEDSSLLITLSYINYPIILELLSFRHLEKCHFKDNSQDSAKYLGANYRH